MVDQIADKICATMHQYAGQPSSREKDLIDLVVLAVSYDIDGSALHRAIRTGIQRRHMEHIEQFVVPAEWGAIYEKLARTVPYCTDFESIDAARDLASAFIDPVLHGTVTDQTWRHNDRAWGG